MVEFEDKGDSTFYYNNGRVVGMSTVDQNNHHVFQSWLDSYDSINSSYRDKESVKKAIEDLVNQK